MIHSHPNRIAASSPHPRRAVVHTIGSEIAENDLSRFSTLANAYRRRSGLADGDEVIRMMRTRVPQPISTLARWIVSHEVISLAWQSCLMLPLFQFELSTMTLRDGPRRVSLELREVFDDWDLAQWFVAPNCWLHDSAPIDRLEDDLAAVLQAARADRFIVTG